MSMLFFNYQLKLHKHALSINTHTQTPFWADESEAAPWKDPWEGRVCLHHHHSEKASSWRKVNKPQQVERSESDCTVQPPTQWLFILVKY